MRDPSLVDFFDRVAGSYDQQTTAQERQARTRLLQLLAVAADESVLEIGCGTGVDLAEIARSAGAGNVQAVDASSKMIELARARLEEHRLTDVQLHHRLAPPLPPRERTLDAVSCAFTLELQPLPDAWHLLLEIRRALRPGGRLGAACLLATWPDPLGLSHSAANWLDRYVKGDHDAVDWKTMCEDAGLEVVTAERTEVRRLAADVLVARRRDGEPALPPPPECVRALGSRRPLDRIRGRQRLCLHGAESLPLLLPLLADGDETIRAETAKCLGWIGEPQGIEPLTAALEDGSQKVRWIAAEGLVAQGAAGERAVVRRLTHPSEDTHRLYGAAGHVIRELHRRGRRHLAPLVEALEQSEPQTSVPVAASRLRQQGA